MTQRRSNPISAQHSFKSTRNSESEDLPSEEIFPRMMEILRKPSESRSSEDLSLLIRSTSSLSFFQTINSKKGHQQANTHQKCAKLMKYKFFPKGHTVLRFGELPDSFYIILKGSVSILIPKDSETMRKERETLADSKKHLLPSPPSYPSTPFIRPDIRSKNISTPLLPSLTKPSPLTSPPLSIQNPPPSSSLTSPPPSSLIPPPPSSQIPPPFLPSLSSLLPSPPSLLPSPSSSSSSPSVQGLSKAWKAVRKVARMLTFLKVSGGRKEEGKKEEVGGKKEGGGGGGGGGGGRAAPNEQMRKEVEKMGLGFEEMNGVEHFFEGGVLKYHLIGKMQTGQAFGELGLLRRKPRAATILCTENTHLAVISKEDYEIIYFNLESQKLKMMIKFFRDSLGKPLATDTLTKYAYLFQKKKFCYGDVVFKEGDGANEVFLIKKGEIEIRSGCKIDLDKAKGQKNLSLFLQAGGRKEMIPKGILGEGEYIGEEDVLLNKPRSFDAVCVSSCASIYLITKPNFFKILHEYKEIQSIFMERIEYKEAYHLDQHELLLKTLQQTKHFSTTIKKSHNIVKCSASDFYDIISNQKMDDEPIHIIVFKKKGEGMKLRGLRKNNPLHLYTDYPLIQNVKHIVKSNKATLKNLIDSNRKDGEDEIFKENKNNSVFLKSICKNLQTLPDLKEKHFRPTNLKNKTLLDFYKDSILEKKLGRRESGEETGIVIEGRLEKSLRICKTIS